jgi:excisionase family DNA binding protein
MLDVDRMYLRPKDVAQELGLTASAVYKMMHRGELPSVRFGRSVRIPAPAFEAWRRACEAGQWVPIREGEGAPPGPAADLEDRRHEFEQRAGKSPEDFVEAWRSRDVEDDGETTALMIEALSLRRIAGDEVPSAAVYPAEPAAVC